MGGLGEAELTGETNLSAAQAPKLFEERNGGLDTRAGIISLKEEGLADAGHIMLAPAGAGLIHDALETAGLLELGQATDAVGLERAVLLLRASRLVLELHQFLGTEFRAILLGVGGGGSFGNGLSLAAGLDGGTTGGHVLCSGGGRHGRRRWR